MMFSGIEPKQSAARVCEGLRGFSLKPSQFVYLEESIIYFDIFSSFEGCDSFLALRNKNTDSRFHRSTIQYARAEKPSQLSRSVAKRLRP